MSEASTPPVTRYFHLVNSNRELFATSPDGKERIKLSVRFEPYSLSAGTLLGMCRTSDAKQLELLDHLIHGEKMPGLSEITKAEFWKNLGVQQTAPNGTFEVIKPLTAPAPTPPVKDTTAGASLENKTGVVVEGGTAAETPIVIASGPVEDVGKAIEVGDVRPTAAAEAKQDRAKRGQRLKPPVTG